jgi:hypothetical protein
MSLFPDFDSITAGTKLQKLEMLLPDVMHEYGAEKRVSLLVNSKRVLENDEFFKDV